MGGKSIRALKRAERTPVDADEAWAVRVDVREGEVAQVLRHRPGRCHHRLLRGGGRFCRYRCCCWCCRRLLFLLFCPPVLPLPIAHRLLRFRVLLRALRLIALLRRRRGGRRRATAAAKGMGRGGEDELLALFILCVYVCGVVCSFIVDSGDSISRKHSHGVTGLDNTQADVPAGRIGLGGMRRRSVYYCGVHHVDRKGQRRQ